MRHRVLLLALVLLATSNLFAQVVIDVEVVDVPVFVARGDKPVAGLTADKFELLVNGKPQPIEYFEAVSARDEAPTLRERRLYLLMFDMAFSQPFAMPRAQRAAAQLIANAAPGDYFAVATYSNRRGIWFAAPFTRDREALGRAIRSLNSSRSGDPLAIVMTDSERAATPDWTDTRSFGTAETARDLARVEAVRAAEDQIELLGALSERLGAIEGQKHVVFLSEGWSEVDLSTLDDLVTMHHRFDTSGVFLHAVDLEGVPIRSLGGKDSLYALTNGTGGKLIHSRNDIGRALASLSASLDHGYRIGFRAMNVKHGYNTIEVRVKERGVRVDHRRGFSSAAGRANTDDGLYLADVVLNDVPQTGTAAVLTLREGTLSAYVPMRELVAQGRKAELLVYAFAADGSALMYHREVIPVSLSEEGKTFAIAVPEGTTVAKALLRVNGSVGFSRAAL